MKVNSLKLSHKLAQSIVNKMMKQIPYNINMMDDTGYIIASGDSSRINTFHIGALETIKAQKTIPMSESYGNHGLPGVNTPVFFDKKVIGVIGITGDPEKVTPLASLLEIATELLVSQDQNNKKKQQDQMNLTRFLYNWGQVTDNIENHEDLILEAKKLNIDIFVPRVAIAIQGKNCTKTPVDQEDYKIDLSASSTIVLTKLKSSINRYLSLSKKEQFKMGIGSFTINIGNSINESLRTIQLNEMFENSNFLYYHDVHFIDMLLKKKLPVDKLVKKFEAVEESSVGDNLINTLAVYIKNNGNIINTSNTLFIHRNTLTYRLKRIKETFGLDPHNMIALFQLYIGLIYFIYQKSINKNGN